MSRLEESSKDMSNSRQSLRGRILDLIDGTPERMWRREELAEQLSLRARDSRKIAATLSAMVLAGEIAELRPGGFGPSQAADLLTGRLNVSRGGGAVVSDSKGQTVLVSPEDQATALPGDLVTVRQEAAAAGDPVGKGRVIRIVRRGAREIAGTLRSTGRFFYVVPIDPVYKQDFYVPGSAGAKAGDRVVIRFLGWPNRHVNPEAEIVEILGPSSDPSLDTELIIRHYGLARTFPEQVLRGAEEAVERMDVPGRRLDCRDLAVVTIDPESARDYDDALSLVEKGKGVCEVGIHIADVSHFVRPGSALDKEARERGTSVYLPDLVLPMLPEQLSNGVCSLRPDEDRLAFSVFLTLDPKGQVTGRRFARTRIRSRLRLTYGQAMTIIDGGNPPGVRPAALGELGGMIRRLHELAQKVRRRRFSSFALDLEVPDCEIIVGPDGRLQGVRPVDYDASHQLIEEFMVLANEAVAGELQGRGWKIISRLHEPPDQEKIEELRAELKVLGFQPGDLGRPGGISSFLDSIREHPLRRHANMLVLRSMKRAVYSTEDSGHYGLGKQHYAHFTSPIRRYPDLTLHRQLSAFLAGRNPGSRANLQATAVHCSEREQIAEEASRSIVEIKKLRFLQQQLDDGKPLPYRAVIGKVTNFGLFVDVDDLQITGLVHVSSMSENFVRYNPADNSLLADGEVFRIGGSLTVRVAKVDFDQRRADFVPDRQAVRRGRQGRSGRGSRMRQRRRDKIGPRSAKVRRR